MIKKTTEKLKTYFKDEAIKQLLYQKNSTSACGKLYKAGLWNSIRFQVGEPVFCIENRTLITSDNVAGRLKVHNKEFIVAAKRIARKLTKKINYVE